ncbi:hypothetical protein [Paracidovorax cattleyae]|uniref:hypothetical protein n=1 Tax=Paracidovorax cattleyae TaxID=80868 RepID=UPI0018AFC536|nr:hypothetical protein [Paracidovorax cattleyae]MBF9263924.1 hypothetical protein [Paracidovorax cattleyae]UYL85475.1 hypothetical protein gp20c [Acidovorax phage Aval]
MLKNFLFDVLTQSAVAAGLLAVVATLFKTQIAHWLNKDMERLKSEFARDLEEVKSQKSKELEEYRVALIAAAETARSAAEVKKAGALFILEKRMDAMMKLYKTLTIVSTSLPARCTLKDKTVETSIESHEKLAELHEAIDDARPFIGYDSQLLLNKATSTGIKIVRHFSQPGTPDAPAEMTEEFMEACAVAKSDLIAAINMLAAV